MNYHMIQIPMENSDSDFTLTPQQEKIMKEKLTAMVKSSIMENRCGTMEKKARAKQKETI